MRGAPASLFTAGSRCAAGARYARAVRRSEHLRITILCPHFARPVGATRNAMNEKLVDCDDKQACVTVHSDERGATIEVRPSSCPVFRQDGRG
jgi:hypothetical protein